MRGLRERCATLSILRERVPEVSGVSVREEEVFHLDSAEFCGAGPKTVTDGRARDNLGGLEQSSLRSLIVSSILGFIVCT